MIVVRPTQNLAKCMRIKLQPNAAKSTTVLGDWSAIDLKIGAKQFIFCMSERGRLPVVMNAAPYANFPERLADRVAEVLLMIGVEESKARQEWRGMREYVLGKTDDRSVLGTMKQFIIDLSYVDLSPYDLREPIALSLHLVDEGSLVLPEFTPRESVLKLFGSAPKEKPPTLRLVR